MTFDFRNYSAKSKYYDNSNAFVVGKMMIKQLNYLSKNLLD